MKNAMCKKWVRTAAAGGFSAAALLLAGSVDAEQSIKTFFAGDPAVNTAQSFVANTPSCQQTAWKNLAKDKPFLFLQLECSAD